MVASAKASSAPNPPTFLQNVFFISSILPSAIFREGRSALAVKFSDYVFVFGGTRFYAVCLRRSAARISCLRRPKILQPQGLLNLKYHGDLKVLLSGRARQKLGKAPVAPLLQCPV
jgi:hypothetical protein